MFKIVLKKLYSGSPAVEIQSSIAQTETIAVDEAFKLADKYCRMKPPMKVRWGVNWRFLTDSDYIVDVTEQKERYQGRHISSTFDWIDSD